MTTTARSGPLQDIAGLLSTVLPMITGSKATATESTVVDPTAMAGVQQLLSSIMPLASGQGMDFYAPLLKTATDQARQQMLPVVGQAGASGLYRSTAVQDLGARATAKAVNDAFGQILQAQGNAQQSAAGLLSNLVRSSSTTKKTTATPGNPIAQLLTAGATGAGVLQKMGVIGGKKTPTAAGKTPKQEDRILQEGFDQAMAGDPGLISESIAQGKAATGGAEAAFGENFSSLAGYDTTMVNGITGPMAIATDMLDPAAWGGFDAAAGATGAAELGASMFAPEAWAGFDAALGGGAAVAEGAGLLGSLGGAASFLGPVGAAVGLVSMLAGEDGPSVICAEARRQGLMDEALYQLEVKGYYPRLHTTTVQGYHFLAAPAVRWMKRSKRAAKFFAAGANAYAKQTTGVAPNLRGRLIQLVGEPLCYIVGKLLPAKGKELAHG